MNTDSPPLVAPTQELANEAMINEGGAIAQPQIRADLVAKVEKPHLKRMFAALGVGLFVGWILARD